MHRLCQNTIELDPRFPAMVFGNVDRFAKTDGRPTERSGRCLAVAQANWNDRHLHAAALGQARQADQPLVQVNRLVLPMDAPFCLSQVAGHQPEDQSPDAASSGMDALIHEATQPLQKPTLKTRHLRCRDHEAAIASVTLRPAAIGSISASQRARWSVPAAPPRLGRL